MVLVEVKHENGQTRMVDPIDLKRWKRKGYFAVNGNKKPKAKTDKKEVKEND